MIDDSEQNVDKEDTKSSENDIRYIPLDLQSIHDHSNEGIDLEEAIAEVWEGRKTIAKSIVIFGIVGLLIALFSVDEFRSEVKVVPESGESFSFGALGSLAQQFGFSSIPEQNRESISANLYPAIIQSNVFIENLMQYEVYVADASAEVSVKNYFREYVRLPLIDYTILLPFTIKKWLTTAYRNELTHIDRELFDQEKIERLTYMSKLDWETLREIRERISASLDSEMGTVTVSVKMQDPVIAADIADEVVRRLADYITEKRTEKVRQNVEFIENRFEEAKASFEEAQRALAEFSDQNRGQLTAMAQTQQRLLQSRYDLSFNIYNSMAERLEEARIELQKETPVVNILEPASIPDQRTEPNTILILIIYLFLGLISGLVIVFSKPFYQRIKARLFA
jgi:uncharacterized protein involved in exopolysaccharide biosynthesis